MSGTSPGAAEPYRIVVLISGRGSNLQAIIRAVQRNELPVQLCAVLSNRPDAEGLAHARNAGVPTEVIDHRVHKNRDDFDRAMMERIDRYRPNLVVLAGFMRVLGNDFIDHYHERMINIHPSLLPAFPGLNTHARAIGAGARVHGATVHFVTRDVDAGPIIAQAEVPVMTDDTPDTLAARVLVEEHRIYPQAIRWLAEGRVQTKDGKVTISPSRQ